MITSVRALPYACLRPFLDELQHDSAVAVEALHFDDDFSFSDLACRDLVPWIRGWPDEIRALLKQAMAHEWKFSREQLLATIENSDMNVLIRNEHSLIWRGLYRNLYDGDLDADSEAMAEITEWDDISFDPGEPEPLWLWTERQRRSLDANTATITVDVGGRVVGQIRRICLRDMVSVGHYRLTSLHRYSAPETAELCEVLEALVPSVGSVQPGLSGEQVAALRLIKAAAWTAQANDIALTVSAH